MISYIKRISSLERNPVLDLFRALAVLLVVQVHYFINFQDLVLYSVLKEGNIGVDIFFVLSGYLVSRGLLSQLSENKTLDYKTFYIKRLFKILPSFYFAILAAFVIYNYSPLFPSLSFEANEIVYYLTFTQNYSGSTILYHAWSLCVEEHFYIVLPLGLLLFARFFNFQKNTLLNILIFSICMGYVIRLISFNIDYETYASTHNRIDAIILGVILALLEIKKSAFINTQHALKGRARWIFILGIVLFSLTLAFQVILNELNIKDSLFSRVFFHGLIPLSIFIILSQTYKIQIKIPVWIKLTAYFSYNWYLWHYIVVQWFVQTFDHLFLGFTYFVILSLLISAIVTFIIEEPFIRMRNRVIKYIKT